MNTHNIPLAALTAMFALGSVALVAQAQVPPTVATVAYSIHDDLLKCYEGLGRNAETETEYKWLVSQRPNNAIYHFNYAVFLQHGGRNKAALDEYAQAALFDSSNVDMVGTCGQMYLHEGNYTKADQYLNKAVSMPGGEKYKPSLDACKQYLQRQMNSTGAGKNSKASPGKVKAKDDDDD